MRDKCDQCRLAYINGLRCHETGCPEAWRDETVECFDCGCEFFRQVSYFEIVCPGCVADRLNDLEFADMADNGTLDEDLNAASDFYESITWPDDDYDPDMGFGPSH